jgi:ribosomal protein S18 acetylase RimI-like enzyme
MPVTLEMVRPAEAMVFKDVRLRALRDAPGAFGSTYAKEAKLTDEDWAARVAQWTGETSTAYLAMDAGLACGIAAGYVDRDDATCAELVSMWVAPTHRRAGVGRELVQAVREWARARGVRRLLLCVTCTNTGAIAFYERLGFTMTGRTKPYPNDPAVIEYEMSIPTG